MNRYETADHDYMHAKDYFSNYKFGYIERTTKTLLLQSLRPDQRQPEDLLGILNQSKSQLKSVKQVGKDASAAIAKLSELIHDAKERLLKCEEMLSDEEARERALAEEYSRLESLDEGLRTYDELAALFDKGCKEVQEGIDRMNAVKREVEALSTREVEDELARMRERKEKLSARQKRLSLITMESYVEDSYTWYVRALEFVENAFGIRLVTVEQESNEMYMRFDASGCEVGIFIRDGQMVDSKLYNASDGNAALSFEALSRLATLVNDPRILLMQVASRCKEAGRSDPLQG